MRQEDETNSGGESNEVGWGFVHLLITYLSRISCRKGTVWAPGTSPKASVRSARFMEREDMLAHVQAGNSYHSYVPGVPGASGQLTGKAQILLLLWKWDYFTKCQRQKEGGLGFRFQKEDGQEEESGMRTNIIIPPSGREGAWGLCVFFPVPLSDCICPLEIQPSDYLQEPLTQAQFNTLSIPGIKREGGKRQWELGKAGGWQGANSIRRLWEKQSWNSWC